MNWSLLAALPEDEQQQVLASARRRQYERGELVVQEGDPSDALHLVASGRLAVRVSTPEGAHATINLLGPGDYFGELSLLAGSPPVRSATIMALEPAETLALSPSAFRDLRTRHRGADQLLLSLMARRIEELSARLLEATYAPLEHRLARRLLELTDLYAAGPGPVTIPLTQEQIAELVGGTRPSVNQLLQELATRGVVELGRGKVVADRDALARSALER